VLKNLLAHLFPSASRSTLRNRFSLEVLEARELLATFAWIGGSAGANEAQQLAWDYKQNWQVIEGGSNEVNGDQTLPVNGSMLDAGHRAPNSGDTFRFTNTATTDCIVNAFTTVASLQLETSYTKHLLLGKDGSLMVNGGYMKTVTPGGNNYTVGATTEAINRSVRTVAYLGEGATLHRSFTIGQGATFTWNSGTFANVQVEVSYTATLKLGWPARFSQLEPAEPSISSKVRCFFKRRQQSPASSPIRVG
jgi:hypothetical protein